MKSILILLFLILFSSYSNAQELTGEEIILSKDRSEWVINYYNGDILIGKHSTFSDGTSFYKGMELNGLVTVYYPDGSLMKKLSYSKGKRNGTCTFYRKDLSIYREAEYFDDKLNGTVREYFSNRKLKFLENWHKGSRKGFQLIYDPNGKIRERILWRNGLMYKVLSSSD